MTPPTPEELANIASDWEKSRPNIAPPKPINASLLADAAPKKPKAPPNKQKKKESLLQENHLQSPALSEYGILAQKGSDTLIKLATHLETTGEFQRALLAWERVLDTTTPSEDTRKKAITSIKRLKSSLPPWNIDPNADIKLILRAGATLKNHKTLTAALTSAADFINQASGHVLQIDVKASFGRSSGIKTPRIPIAIWFSRPGDPPAETTPISFMADPKQTDLFTAQIEAAIYALVRAQLTQKTNFTPLPEYPQTEKPEDVLQYYITRLMWREFANSLKEEARETEEASSNPN